MRGVLRTRALDCTRDVIRPLVSIARSDSIVLRMRGACETFCTKALNDDRHGCNARLARGRGKQMVRFTRRCDCALAAFVDAELAAVDMKAELKPDCRDFKKSADNKSMFYKERVSSQRDVTCNAADGQQGGENSK